ncbi:MAG: hypothetical protein WA517_22830 [Candidatus Acidiferrum sp.]
MAKKFVAAAQQLMGGNAGRVTNLQKSRVCMSGADLQDGDRKMLGKSIGCGDGPRGGMRGRYLPIPIQFVPLQYCILLLALLYIRSASLPVGLDFSGTALPRFAGVIF